MKPNYKNPLLAAVITLTLAAPAALAVPYYWDGNDSTANFAGLNASSTWAAPTVGTATNGWSTDLTGATVVLANSITTTTADALNFGTGVTNRGLGGGTLTVSGTVDALSLAFGSQTTSNILITGGTINLAPSAAISVGAGSTTVMTIASNLTGAATSLTKSGNILALSGTNTYTGPTNITAGTLVYRNTGAKAAGTHTFSAATTLGLGVATSGSFFTSTDVDNAFAGSMTGNLSNVAVATDTRVGIDTTAGSFTYATSVAGSPTRGLTKLGGNTLTLTGANTFTGSADIRGGTLRLENTAAVAGSSAVTVNTGTTLQVAANAASTFTTTGLSSTAGTITSDRIAAGVGRTHILGDAMINNGTTNITAGTNVTSGTAAIQLGNVTNNNGSVATPGLSPTSANLIITGNVTLGTSNAGTANFTLGGTSTGNSIGGAIGNGTRVTGNVIKSGTGTWTLNGANTYNGTTTISAGRLQFATQASLYNNNTVPGAGTGWTAANINVQSTGSIGFNVGGIGEFTTTDVTTLLTTLAASSGPLIGMNAGSSFAFDTTNASGGSFTIADVIADSTGASGGARSLTKLGTNTLMLTNANTYTGTTTISGGTLRLENTLAVQNSSAISTGANTLQIATDTPFSFAGGISMSNGGTITSDRASSGAGLTHAFGGNLSVAHGSTYNFTKGANATGTTAAIQFASMNCGSGSGGTATLNPTTADLIIVGGYQGFTNGGTSALGLGGTSQGNRVDGAIANGTRATQSVIKSSTSIWALNGANTYSGNTTVNGGTLTLSNAPDPLNANPGNDASTVTIAATGATLNLTYTGTDKVDKLFIGGVQQAAGIYGPSAIPLSQIIGTGTLTVLSSPPAGYSSWASLNGASLTDRSADHDFDGVPNGVEFFIGGPTGNTTGFTALPSVVNTAGVLSVTWTEAAGYIGIYGTDFSVETSATLTGVWTTETSGVTVTFPSATEVKYTFPAGTINFARLKVTGP